MIHRDVKVRLAYKRFSLHYDVTKVGINSFLVPFYHLDLPAFDSPDSLFVCQAG